MREFREWAGEPPYRVMAERSGWGASTLNTIITSTDLPNKLVKVNAVLIGCGASKEDHERFASAWRRLRSPDAAAQNQPQIQPLLQEVPPGSLDHSEEDQQADSSWWRRAHPDAATHPSDHPA